MIIVNVYSFLPGHCNKMYKHFNFVIDKSEKMLLLSFWADAKSSVFSWWWNYPFLFNFLIYFHASLNRRSPVSSQPPMTKGNLSGKIFWIHSKTLYWGKFSGRKPQCGFALMVELLISPSLEGLQYHEGKTMICVVDKYKVPNY